MSGAVDSYLHGMTGFPLESGSPCDQLDAGYKAHSPTQVKRDIDPWLISFWQGAPLWM